MEICFSCKLSKNEMGISYYPIYLPKKMLQPEAITKPSPQWTEAHLPDYPTCQGKTRGATRHLYGFARKTQFGSSFLLLLYDQQVEWLVHQKFQVLKQMEVKNLYKLYGYGLCKV